MSAIALDVMRTRRLRACRFRSLTAASLKPAHVPIDDRGFAVASPTDGRCGPLLSVGGQYQARRVDVSLERLDASNREPLFVSLRGGLTLDASGGRSVAKLPAKRRSTLTFFVPRLLMGKRSPLAPIRQATVDVHHGSGTGPRVARLHVDVYAPMQLFLMPRVLRVASPSATLRRIDHERLIKRLMAVRTDLSTILAPTGIEPTVIVPKSSAQELPVLRVAQSRSAAALRDLERRGWDPGGIYSRRELYLSTCAVAPRLRPWQLPICLVPRIAFPNRNKTSSWLGWAFGRGSRVLRAAVRPSLFVSEEIFSMSRYDQARTLAHEIGHCLGLWHPDNRNVGTDPHMDAHVRRMAMYPYATFPAGRGEPIPDVGYGGGRPGTLFSSKDTAKWAYKGVSGGRPAYVPEIPAMRAAVRAGFASPRGQRALTASKIALVDSSETLPLPGGH